jgi:hypothetical protein
MTRAWDTTWVHPESLRAAAAELIALRPDVIFAPGVSAEFHQLADRPSVPLARPASLSADRSARSKG